MLRQYTAPTCTLEITATESPLSRWAGQSVLKHLRFQLSFDAPQIPEEQRVVLKGDRTQLEALCTAVETYVQKFLTYEPEGTLQATSLHLKDSGIPSAVSDEGNSSEADALNPDAESSRQTATSEPVPLTTQPDSTATGGAGASNLPQIHLQPRGLLTHELVLGSLKPQGSEQVLSLSVIQLSDLATALDEYASEAIAIPTLSRPQWLTTPPAWLRTAAVVVVTASLTTLLIKFLDTNPLQTSPQIASQSSEKSQPSPNLGVPATPLTVPVPSVFPPTGSSSPAPSPTTAIASPQPSPVASPPPDLTLTQIPVPPQELPPPPPADLSLQPLPPSSPQKRVTIPDDMFSTVPSTAVAPSTATAPSDPSAAKPIPNLAEIAAAPRLSSAGVSRQTRSANTSLDQAGNEAGRDTPSSPSSLTRGNSTAFDTLPQVAEARSYFQQRWQPPQGLTQLLEYTLVLNRNGSIQRIVPLGEAAGNYIDRTSMPLVGEPFVSAIEGSRTPRIRVVLSPTGTVQTFLERLD
ncbi:MAG: DUF4335 domain-containing protein [Leptolyngbyaceae bacterium]|nr:DUF4335 domain-containing protein [Leptolyngbyaceae bacterium]